MNVFYTYHEGVLQYICRRKKTIPCMYWLFIFVGNAITTCKSNDKVKVLTVRGTAFEAAKTSGSGVASENGTSLNNNDSKIFFCLCGSTTHLSLVGTGKIRKKCYSRTSLRCWPDKHINKRIIYCLSLMNNFWSIVRNIKFY